MAFGQLGRHTGGLPEIASGNAVFDLDLCFANHDVSPFTAWLRENVLRPGNFCKVCLVRKPYLNPTQTAKATGARFSLSMITSTMAGRLLASARESAPSSSAGSSTCSPKAPRLRATAAK